VSCGNTARAKGEVGMNAKEQELIEARDEARCKWDEANREWDEADSKMVEARRKWCVEADSKMDEACFNWNEANRKWDEADHKSAEAYHKWVEADCKLWEYRKSKA